MAGKRDRVDAEVLHALQARRATVRVGVHDHLGAAVRAESDTESMSPTIMSGLYPASMHRVGSAVDADQHRAVLADVGTQRFQVLPVVVAAHDDEDVLVVHVGRTSGTPTPSSSRSRSRLHVLHGVRHEGLELLGQPGAGLLHGGQHVGRSSSLPAASGVSPRSSTFPSMRSRSPSLGQPHHLGADLVDQRDARRDDDLRSEVGVPAGDRGGGVDHGRGLAGRPGTRRRPGRCPRGR